MNTQNRPHCALGHTSVQEHIPPRVRRWGLGIVVMLTLWHCLPRTVAQWLLRNQYSQGRPLESPLLARRHPGIPGGLRGGES